jgi:hypothetical protein
MQLQEAIVNSASWAAREISWSESSWAGLSAPLLPTPERERDTGEEANGKTSASLSLLIASQGSLCPEGAQPHPQTHANTISESKTTGWRPGRECVGEGVKKGEGMKEVGEAVRREEGIGAGAARISSIGDIVKIELNHVARDWAAAAIQERERAEAGGGGGGEEEEGGGVLDSRYTLEGSVTPAVVRYAGIRRSLLLLDVSLLLLIGLL